MWIVLFNLIFCVLIYSPENVHRLFDLIRVEDERVLPAFYHALHDTLVANDLEQATRIAYGATRYRVVTLKGEMIEISGKMSGGGRSMMRGRMGQTVATKTSKSTGTPNRGNAQSIERLQVGFHSKFIYIYCLNK